jgi:tetratricopeptide (TPR) repeat protein
MEEDMRFLRLAPGLLLLALVSALPLRAQDWRGTGRLDGWIKDPSGQPIADATLKFSREAGAGPTVKSDKKGYWAVLGLAGGTWSIDISAAGFETRKITVRMSEMKRVPPMELQLQKGAASPAAAPAVVDPAAKAGAEAIAAVTEGNKLLSEKKFAQARAEYEKAIALLPPNAGLWRGVAQTYHGEGNEAKTIETLRKASELDPADAESRLLLASLLVAQGQLDEGKAVLEGLPAGSVKDPAIYINLGIVLINKNKPLDAVVYITKAIEIDATSADSYYYRGMANFQAKKKADAKADFTKYLELAPNGPEAKDVKEMLQALK